MHSRYGFASIINNSEAIVEHAEHAPRLGINRDIEVLRAIAILFVLFQHRSFLLVEKSSHVIDMHFQFWAGVDLFFVISGFVIARGLLQVRAASTTTLDFAREAVAFWIRRVWRLWPTLWLWLGIGLLLSAFRGGQWGSFLDNLSTATGVLSLTENFHHALDCGPKGTCSNLVFGPYWTLSLEEQFYLLLPLLLLFTPSRHVLRILSFGVAVQFFLARPGGELLWLIRSDALLMGVGISYSLQSPFMRQILEPTFLSYKPIRYACTSLLLFLVAGVASYNIVSFTVGMVALLSAVLVWIASYDKNYVLPENALKRVLVWLGARSYAIYIIHLFAFNFAKSLWHRLLPDVSTFGPSFTIRFSVTALVIMLVLAEANYRLVESPLRKKGRIIAKRFCASAQPSRDLPREAAERLGDALPAAIE